MNLKSINKNTINDAQFPGSDNSKIIFGIQIKLTNEADLYERKTFNILDMLGKIGGLKEAFNMIFGIIIFIF